MILVRFGNPNPCYQSHEIDNAKYLQTVDISLFPIHLRESILKNKQDITPDFEKYSFGYWWFVGEPPEESIRFQLNHKPELANSIKTVKDFDDNILAYTNHRVYVGNPTQLKNLYNHEAVFIPTTKDNKFFYE